MLLHDLLLHAERTSASRAAIVDGALERDYGTVANRIRRAAAGLLQAGLEAGQRVALISPNTSAFFEGYFALSMAGLIAVPVNTRLSAPEISFVLDDCTCAAVLYDENYAHLLPSLAGRMAISFGSANRGDSPTWDGLIEASEPMQPTVTGRSEDDVAHIFYTGGTTGRPKGVMLSHRNVAASATNKIVLGGFARDDVWLHAAPMFHQADAWAVFSFSALGATHVFLPAFAPRPALELIDRHGVTGFQLVPTMIFMMLDEPDVESFDLSSIRRILFGSAPMPMEMLKRATRAFGDVFQHIYGLTEAAGTVASTPWPPQTHEREGARLASCGQAIPGVDLRIAGRDGTAMPVGSIGNIQVRGANVMTGYWNRAEETAAAFVDGWLDTGDLGRLDDDGFVFIVDRSKDMIITGGENVYSTEVEDVIYAHPAVAEAAVIGQPDDKWGEAVTACVVRKRQTTLTEAELISHCRASLAGYKCPKSVLFLDQLPKSAAGKILKHELRANRHKP
jgi:long-chain acyl-CoA synthetase